MGEEGAAAKTGAFAVVAYICKGMRCTPSAYVTLAASSPQSAIHAGEGRNRHMLQPTGGGLVIWPSLTGLLGGGLLRNTELNAGWLQ